MAVAELDGASAISWCVIEDFNNIMRQEEARGCKPYPAWLINGFNDVAEEVGLRDLELCGHQFTWEKDRGTKKWKEIRLDLAMVNEGWWDFFMEARLVNIRRQSNFLSKKARNCKPN